MQTQVQRTKEHQKYKNTHTITLLYGLHQWHCGIQINLLNIANSNFQLHGIIASFIR